MKNAALNFPKAGESKFGDYGGKVIDNANLKALTE